MVNLTAERDATRQGVVDAEKGRDDALAAMNLAEQKANAASAATIALGSRLKAADAKGASSASELTQLMDELANVRKEKAAAIAAKDAAQQKNDTLFAYVDAMSVLK